MLSIIGKVSKIKSNDITHVKGVITSIKCLYVERESKALRLRLVYFMRSFLITVLTAGLCSPTAAIADTYDALCNEDNCQITIDESGLSGPLGFISKEKITQWYSGGDEYNLALGSAGSAAGGTVGLAAATAACFTGVLCPVALAAGVFGGGKVGAKLGKGKNYFFTVMGQKDDGSNIIQSFRFLNKKTAKTLQKELIKLTSLQMGQVKVIER